MSTEGGVTRARVLFFLRHHGPLSFAELAAYLAERPTVLFGPAGTASLRTLLYSMWQEGLIAGAQGGSGGHELLGWALTEAGANLAAVADPTSEDDGMGP
jgi:hypothetical protein